MVLLLAWSCTCVQKERAGLKVWGVYSRSADRHSLRDAGEGPKWQGHRWLGGLGGTGVNPSYTPTPPFRRPQKGSGYDWPCDCQGRSLGCCWTMRGSPCFLSAARSRPAPWQSGRPLILWWTQSWWLLAQAPCSSSQGCGGNAPQSPGHRLCWLQEGKEQLFLNKISKTSTTFKGHLPLL